jgi:hypothetical protein
MPTQFLNPPGLCPTNGWTHVVTSTGGKPAGVACSRDGRRAAVAGRLGQNRGAGSTKWS